MVVLTAVVAVIVFAAVGFGLVWLVTHSLLTLGLTIAAAVGFVVCVAHGNGRDGW